MHSLLAGHSSIRHHYGCRNEHRGYHLGSYPSRENNVRHLAAWGHPDAQLKLKDEGMSKV